MLAYYSSRTGNTHRFVEKTDIDMVRITDDQPLSMSVPFILCTPTYSDRHGVGAVPKAIIHFLNNVDNRSLLRGVVGFGNRNFGETFALGGRIVSNKCKVPFIHAIELAGMASDVNKIRDYIQGMNDER